MVYVGHTVMKFDLNNLLRLQFVSWQIWLTRQINILILHIKIYLNTGMIRNLFGMIHEFSWIVIFIWEFIICLSSYHEKYTCPQCIHNWEVVIILLCSPHFYKCALFLCIPDNKFCCFLNSVLSIKRLHNKPAFGFTLVIMMPFTRT